MHQERRAAYVLMGDVEKAPCRRNNRTALNLLGNIYTVQGRFAEAEEIYLRALRIGEASGAAYLEEVFGCLAAYYRIRGLYDRSQAMSAHALSITERSYGRFSLEVVENLLQQALAMLGNHPLGNALPLLDRAFQNIDQHLREEGLIFSEGRLAAYLKRVRDVDEVYFNLLHEHPGRADITRRALQSALLHKARSAQELSDISRAIYLHLGPADRIKYQQLRSLRSEQAALLFDARDQRTPEQTRARLDDLKTRAEALETELAQRSVLLQAQRQQPTPDDILPRIAAALPADSVLVEFVAYEQLPVLTPPRAPGLKQRGTPAYLALLLFPSGEIRTVDLGLGAPIEQVVHVLRAALIDLTRDPRASAQALYRLVMQPLVPHLGGRKRVILSPDGALNLIPFAALHDGTSDLVATYDFTYVTSGRELLPRPTRSMPMDPAHPVVVFADPDFGIRSAPLVAAPVNRDLDPEVPLAARSAPLEQFAVNQAQGLRNLAWLALPGTRREAEQIAALFPHTQQFLGDRATSEALLQISAPYVLHIATHGFFLRAPERLTAAASRDRQTDRNDERKLADSVGGPPPVPEDPMLRSGLTLAGARPVTALELSSMNLWGTALVVLSACDTGQGDIEAGQGVFGLRRAFTVAGAQTVVTSLWRVDDGVTSALMAQFYQRLAAGQGRAEAMKQAMLTVRQTHPHPRHWAPFVVVGNDGPLPGPR